MTSQIMKTNIFNIIDIDSDDESVTSNVNNEKNNDFNKMDIVEKVSNIIPFKERISIPIVQEKENNYQISNTKHSTVTTSSKKNNVIHFVVGTSYKDFKNRYRHNKSDYHRPRQFETLVDKNTIAKSLVGTQVCKNVKRTNDNNEYGVCYRSECTFAHSLSELKDKMCSFDSLCNIRWGKPTRDGYQDLSTRCPFRHSDENREEWLRDTGHKLPDLPLTSENTRIHMKIDIKTPEKLINSKHKSVKPNTPLKSRWDINPLNDSLPDSIYVDSTPINYVKRKLNTWSSESENDLRSKRRYRHRSRSRSHLRSRSRSHLRSRSRYRSRSLTNETHIIRVPSNELAEFAIKTALDSGIYNIKVIVE